MDVIADAEREGDRHSVWQYLQATAPTARRIHASRATPPLEPSSARTGRSSPLSHCLTLPHDPPRAQATKTGTDEAMLRHTRIIHISAARALR